MKERPILFSAPMVRALLDGSKTQTRRVMNPQPIWNPDFGVAVREHPGAWLWGSPAALGLRERGDHWICDFDDEHRRRACTQEAYGWGAGAGCPYGVPSDRLWVREAWAWYGCERDPHEVVYRADTAVLPPLYERWRQSIHMFRWASRITLEVTGVRVERLNEITEGDAIAEGIERDGAAWRSYRGAAQPIPVPPAWSYRGLWESINGADAWAADPWVWVVEFRRA